MRSDPRSMSLARRWVYAAKPASWPKLLVPFVLGQAIGLGSQGRLSLLGLGLGVAFTVFDLLFIVFLNDWADQGVDAIKRRMFPKGCSPKTIPDQILPAHHLLFAGALAGALALGVAVAAHLLLDRPWMVPVAVLALGVFVAYTLPPLRANYRGGGELLEMLGVGVVLPLLHAYLQGGSFVCEGNWFLPGFALLSLAGAVASGLADERSDRRGGKTTIVTRYGNRIGRVVIEALTMGGALVWLLSVPLPFWLRLVPAAVTFYEGGGVLMSSTAAVTDAFAAQKRYKARLHRAIWRGALCAAMLLAWQHLS